MKTNDDNEPIAEPFKSYALKFSPFWHLWLHMSLWLASL